MNAKEYDLIEYYGGDDEFWVVGNIILYGGKFVSAEITDTTISSANEVNHVREFLEEVAAFIDGGCE